MNALNLNRSSEKLIDFGCGPILSSWAQAMQEARKRRVPTAPPGSQTASSCTTAYKQPGERRTRVLGESVTQVPEYDHQCKKRCSNDRVAGDGDRYATMVVSDEVG